MKGKLDSYKPCDCGDDCDYAKDNEPCWGEVHVVQEITWEDGWDYEHACEGHSNCCFFGSYIYYDFLNIL
jgi:hypothetical protein